MKNFDGTSLNQEEISVSHKEFKFGDIRKVIGTSKMKLTAQIGNTKCFIKVEIVREKFLQYLSSTVLNLQNDNIKMLNEHMEVTTSNNGHYAINKLPEEMCNFDSIEQVK